MRRFIVLIIVVLVVAGLWSGGWLYGATRIDSELAALDEGDGISGPKFTCGMRSVTGFPFRFDIACESLTIVSGDMTATLAGVRATFLAYNPTQAKLSALSPLTLSDAFSGAQSRIAFAGVEGSAHVVARDLWEGLSGEGWRILRISLVADGVEWTDTVLGEVLMMSSSHIEAHLLDVPEKHDPTAGTAALAGYASLADVTAPAQGISGGAATLEAELTGLPDDLRALAAPDVLARWRDAAGQLRLVALKGTAGSDFIESAGTLSLDSGARLDGQIQLQSKGLVERIGDIIPPDWKSVLLGGQAQDGSYSQTLTIKAGIVFVGLLPVAMIPPLL
jgi:hypothetical protein